MNHMIDGDAGLHQFSPYFNGKEMITTRRCDICEKDHDESIVYTIQQSLENVCEGCAKSYDVVENHPDSSYLEINDIKKQLKQSI